MSTDVDWRGAGERLRGGRLVEAVGAMLAGRMGRVGVACSGGADSLALLLCVATVLGEERERVWVLHFDHGVRAESAKEALWVKGVAETLGVNFRSERWMEAVKGADEASLRAARRKFLLRAAEDLGLEVLLTGHQLDDVAENFFMRLGRGSGPGALAAPASERNEALPSGGRVQWMRPFLGISREEIEAALREAGLPWLEDASNANARYTRNALRAKVLPAWKAAIPQDWRQGVARSHRLCREDAEALDEWAEALRGRVEADGALMLEELTAAPRAILRRVLERWLRALPGLSDLRSGAVEAFLDWVAGALRAKLVTALQVGGFRILMENGRLRAEAVEPERRPLVWTAQKSPDGMVYTSAEGARLIARGIELTNGLRDTILSGGLDPAEEVWLNVRGVEGLAVRSWAPGDRYHPLGAPGRKKLQDAFVDRGVPAGERSRLPVVLDAEGAILWVPGLLPADAARIVPECNYALRLTYHGPSAKVG